MLEKYKAILEFFNFEVTFEINGMDEEYIECIKKTNFGTIKVIMFENAFTTIISNDKAYSFVSTTVQEFIYKLVSILQF